MRYLMLLVPMLFIGCQYNAPTPDNTWRRPPRERDIHIKMPRREIVIQHNGTSDSVRP